MAVGRKAKAKSAVKHRDAKALQTKAGSSKNLQVKNDDAVIHQRKNTQKKNYQAKRRSNRDLKEKV